MLASIPTPEIPNLSAQLGLSNFPESTETVRHMVSASSVVLVVEDEPSVQTTLSATLAVTGFRTHHADTVESALKILGAEHVDAVMLDVRLIHRGLSDPD
jgi:PleD family two-component response regulator